VSQIFTREFPDPLTIHFPSRENATESTAPERRECPVSVCSCQPTLSSGQGQEITCTKCTQNTPSHNHPQLTSTKLLTKAPVATSQILTTPSSDPLTIRVPSGENATEPTSLPWCISVQTPGYLPLGLPTH